MLQTLNMSNLKFWTNWVTFSINYKFQKILRLSGVGISICFLTSIWMQTEAPLNSISKLLSMVSENDLCDIYRIRNPETKTFHVA